MGSGLDNIFDREQERFVAEWMEFLRFASIGADPAHHADCADCATWLKDHLTAMGLQAEMLETPGLPAVYAEHHVGPSAPTILFYGHYDVQPVDPVEDWTTPPFEPALRDGRLYARGAQDDKGQLFSFLKAVEALLAAGCLDLNLKILIEGEEESGSRGLSAILNTSHERLAADILMVADTGTVPDGTPTIVMGLRGLLHLAVTLRGPSHDLHSGLHGGLALNPVTELTRLLATLFAPDGSIAVDEFYDGIRNPTALEHALVQKTPFDPAAYEKSVGMPPVAGEAEYTPHERLGFRPALDINGIRGGNADSMKTVIPTTATARLTVRLAAGQDPDHCLAAICDHLKAHAPEAMALTIHDAGSAGAGFRIDPESAPVQLAHDVLAELANCEPVYHWEGASIPIIPALAEAAGAAPLLVGFGHEDDHVHAPNESYSVEQFRRGFEYAVHFLRTAPQADLTRN
ncbi:MAG: M20/M25/M40 family metallo-hydrolase [Kiritimatiellae bacterium]|nr:M20/M25/M40 family metallo-hydrolase [Kiritimatiellia bacterium]